MAQEQISVVDADGHLVESIPELAEFMDPDMRKVALNPSRNRQGVFPSLDGLHYPRRQSAPGGPEGETEPRVNASDHRMGSGEDWFAFLEKAGVEQAVMFTSEGLSVGFIQLSEYAERLCQAYNNYVYNRYKMVSDRLHPVALIPMQDIDMAVRELRRAVLDLGLPGAMLPSTGLPLHLGHQYYWPLYEEAARLGCALGVHGGSNRGIGIDTFTDFTASHILHHPVPLMYAMTSLVCHGVLDVYPDLHVAFLEGGCAWLVCLLDRMDRDAEFFAGKAKRRLQDYLQSGQIMIGCEGDDESLAYLAKRVGIEAFAYSSDYPHEVDLPAAKRMIDRTIERSDLSRDEKVAVLRDNALRFFRLTAKAPVSARA